MNASNSVAHHAPQLTLQNQFNQLQDEIELLKQKVSACRYVSIVSDSEEVEIDLQNEKIPNITIDNYIPMHQREINTKQTQFDNITQANMLNQELEKALMEDEDMTVMLERYMQYKEQAAQIHELLKQMQ